MWFKQLMAAATDWRTLIILGLGAVTAAVLSNPFPAIIGLGLYLWAVQRLAGSPQMQAAAEYARVAADLLQRHTAVQNLYRDVSTGVLSDLPRAKDGGWNDRAGDVANAASSIYAEWLADKDVQADKTALVDEGLQLAALYLKLLRGYHAIYTGQHPFDVGAVKARLARNRRRMEESHDLDARRTLMEAIELDERVLDQSADEETAQERHVAKLAAIESTMDLLRREVFDPTSGAEGHRLHEMLLEAEAMDEALAEVQSRTRVRVR